MKIVTLLLLCVMDIDYKDYNGQTALFHVVVQPEPSYDIIELLIKAGVDVSLDNNGIYPILCSYYKIRSCYNDLV